MKTSVLYTIVLAALCLVLLPQQAQAQQYPYNAYGISAIFYDPDTREVFGYSATEVDYFSGFYYDPYVAGYLYGPYGLVDYGSRRGYEAILPAEVHTQAASIPLTEYDVLSDHYIISWYSSEVNVCDGFGFGYSCGYDPFGYSFLPGGYWGGFNYFYPPGYGGYVRERTYYIGSTGIGIITPPDPQPTPTPCSNHTVQIIGGGKDITGTTANALLGAIVTLQAVVDGSGEQANGTYRWIVEDAQDGSNLSSVPNIKNVFWLNEGAKRVTVQFIPNGENCASSATATVNVVVPTQYTFTAYQNNGRVRDDCTGGGLNEFTGTAFSLGCGTRDPGITFNATVQAPGGYISAPNDSGIKLVQLISQFITARGSHGELLCPSTQERSSEFDIDSGWRLDGFDPYGLGAYAPFTLTTPGDPNSSVSASVSVIDSPGVPIQDLTYLRTDLQFEMYLVYFAGDRENPRAQRVLAKVPWNWGGEITFSSPGFYSTFTSYPPSQLRNSVPTPMVSRISDLRAYRPYEGRRTNLVECSGVNPPPDPTPDPTPDPYPDPCYSGYRMNCY